MNEKTLKIYTNKKAKKIINDYKICLLSYRIKRNTLMITLSLESETYIALGYSIMKELYESGFIDNTRIEFNGKRFFLSDDDLERYYFFYNLTTSMMDSFPCPGLLKCIIHDYNIKKYSELYLLSQVKFSELMAWSFLDSCFFHADPFEKEKILFRNHMGLTIYNRYINKQIILKRCKDITFVNCIIDKGILISSSENICFVGCIVREKTVIDDYISSNFEILESIIETIVIFNAKFEKFKLQENKIFRLTIMNSTASQCEWNSIKIDFFSGENFIIPCKEIDLNHINLKNISIKAYSKLCPKNIDSFFLKFYENDCKKRKSSKEEACLSTIDFLLSHSFSENDREAIALLKYRKNLYNLTGIKKVYAFLTGGFYKPLRFVFYVLILNIIMCFMFTIPINEFECNAKIFNSLSIVDSIKYCLSLLLDINDFKYNADGITQVLAIAYKFLNVVFATSFFTSLLKKYIL